RARASRFSREGPGPGLGPRRVDVSADLDRLALVSPAARAASAQHLPRAGAPVPDVFHAAGHLVAHWILSTASPGSGRGGARRWGEPPSRDPGNRAAACGAGVDDDGHPDVSL